MSEMRQPTILRERKNHVPNDIVFNNILTRVPVKSLMRFLCVCKSWNSSITTPNFISTHLYNSKNKHTHHHNNTNGYVIHMPWLPSSSSNRPVCTVAFDRTFDMIYETEIPSDFVRVCIVGSCNGLLCLAEFSGNVIYLWNPSIRKFKKLPDTCLRQLMCVTLGFAYHYENNDYKIVSISSSTFYGREIEVYTLSSDSWRRCRISLPTNVTFWADRDHPNPLVNGALHWMATINREDSRTTNEEIIRAFHVRTANEDTIMAFDVNCEKFRKLELPNNSMFSIDGHARLVRLDKRHLALFKGKLAYIKYGPNGLGFEEYSIWVMREYGVVESWNKLFVVPSSRRSHSIAFTEYGSLLTSYIYGQVKNQEYKFLLIDTKNLQEKELDIQNPSFVTNFMESLVLLDGANVLFY